MLSYRDLVSSLRQLNIETHRPVLVHASLSAFGEVRGGAETLLAALMATVDNVMAPTFTYRTMITPEDGPMDNGITYGSGKDLNRMADFFRPNMPADKLMGVLPETIRRHPEARRSSHPILSFTGIGVDAALNAQTLTDPLAPVRVLKEKGGWVLLLGVNHTSNTALHYAEKLAGRKQFTRWALTPAGIVECPGFPGCSNGFNRVIHHLQMITRTVRVGNALVMALPLDKMLDLSVDLLRKDPLALLCDRMDCERCSAIRAVVRLGLPA